MIKIQNVVDDLLAPVTPITGSVDTLKFGNPQTEVKGIVVAFMASQQVLEWSVAMGANLIITHEGTFFSHHDAKESTYVNDPIYKAKSRFIEESGLAIYRFHDYWHRYEPDGIMEGLIHALDWNDRVTEHLPAASIVAVQPMKLEQVIEHIKKTGNPLCAYSRGFIHELQPDWIVGRLQRWRGQRDSFICKL